MPIDHEPITNTPETTTPEGEITLDNEAIRAKNNELGAKILAQVGFENRHKEIVDSSFARARKNGEKLPGKNDERRNLSYLKRLESLIEEHGNELEQRLWRASVKDDLLIQYDNIPESYWDTKRQELRDNGYGNYELTEEYKHEIYKKERELQEESLERWADYLGDEHSPYPLWFKVYAWDGMTKMGKYNKSKGKYEARNETTIAPYPDPDAEVLAGVFDVVNRYYGNNEKEFYTEEGERNIKLEQIVQSGNFPKIFNAIQQDIAPIIEPPEKTEDAHGEWLEYQIGDEDDIARAARGTGWCVASSSVGRHYLRYGTYGNYDYDHDDTEQNQARFILLHLIDPKTGKLAKNACASIRLDPDGDVAEISGLKNGQALNDSLVPIVEAKAKTLPGGEDFLLAFADKRRLIELDHKLQNGEDLNTDELRFIYELDRPIHTLDTYNQQDPRIKDLKKQYNLEYALSHGISLQEMAPSLKSSDIINNLDALIASGVEIDRLVQKLGDYHIYKEFENLANHGANVDEMVSRLRPLYNIAPFLKTILEKSNNPSAAIETLRLSDIIANYDLLTQHKIDINLDDLIPKLDQDDIVKNFDIIFAHGKDTAKLALGKMSPANIISHIDPLLKYVTMDDIIEGLGYGVRFALRPLVERGVDINSLIPKMNTYDIRMCLDELFDLKANININEFVSKLEPYQVKEDYDKLRKHGADKAMLDQIIAKANEPQPVFQDPLDYYLGEEGLEW